MLRIPVENWTDKELENFIYNFRLGDLPWKDYMKIFDEHYKRWKENYNKEF